MTEQGLSLSTGTSGRFGTPDAASDSKVCLGHCAKDNSCESHETTASCSRKRRRDAAAGRSIDRGSRGSGTSSSSSRSCRSSSCSSSSSFTHPTSRDQVIYFVDYSVTAIAYAENHVMRPSRVRVLHTLVHSLGLDHHMTIATAPPATESEMSTFHRLAYLECLKRASTICGDPFEPTALSFQKEFDVPAGSKKGDCPLFAEVGALVASQAGASLACADAIMRDGYRVAMNWAGGMHHAAAAHASGFCFVNDAVLCIRRLLRQFHRVLYVDIDVHHGDGVEGAFLGNPRVLTVSLHQFGDAFFPGTGDYARAGDEEEGACHRFAVNVPLPARTGDVAYGHSFRLVLDTVVRSFDPEAVVMQCGADTVAGDLIGRLCVSTQMHTRCVADVLALKLPTVLLGGGGYHVFHTAKCWAIHTATAIGLGAAQLPRYVPRQDAYYSEYRKECAPLRPTLHVWADSHVDRPLSGKESRVHLRRLWESVHYDMRAVRLVRQQFTRTMRHTQEVLARRRQCGAGGMATTTVTEATIKEEEWTPVSCAPHTSASS